MKRKRFSLALSAATAAALLLSAATAGAAAEEQTALPDAYSSRDPGYVTSVKSQQYNSCWAFASMATLESTLLRAGYETEDMSTDHLNMWATTHKDGTGWQRGVTSDGYPNIALGYLTSWQGGVFASDADGLSIFNPIVSDDVPVDLARYGVTSVEYLFKNMPEDIKRCIMEHGGVYSSYAHAAECMSADKLSYYMPPNYSGGYSGHSIEVVGWDDTYPRENFSALSYTLPQNNGAWLIKNSWGNNNDLGGYFWMSYEDAYVFGQKYNPSFCLTGVEPLDGTKKLLQNEVYGATYEFDYINSRQLTFLNHFSFDNEFDVIDKVMFKTNALGASYSLYFVPDTPDSTPNTDQTVWTKLYDGTVDHIGYLCADIEDFAYPDSSGSIAVTMDTSASGGSCTIGVGEWLTNTNGYVFINSSKRGDSYILQNGSAQDLMDWYKESQHDDIGGTFVIKAITAKTNRPTLLGDADMDGTVSISDVTEIQRHIAEHIQLTGKAAANADYNQDGVINIDDATAIQRFLAEFAPVSVN